MLLPASADLLLLGVAGVGLVGTLAYLVRGGRLFWVVVGGAVFTVLFTVLFILSVTITCKVVRVVSEGNGQVHAERALLFGSKTLDLGGREVTLGTADAETLIVNETDRALTLRGEVYSSSGSARRLLRATCSSRATASCRSTASSITSARTIRSPRR